MTTEKFLDFKGKKIILINEDGNFYVALKPICEALELDWRNEHGTVSDHPLYGSVIVNLTTTGADKKQYKMVCLPELFLYLWLGSLKPKTTELLEFQKECATILYSHFHKLSDLRGNKLLQLQSVIEKREKFFEQNEELQKIDQDIKSLRRNIKKIDEDFLNSQLSFDY